VREANGISYYNSTIDKLQTYIIDDIKHIIFLDEEEYSLHMKGTDMGTMDYSVYAVEVVEYPEEDDTVTVLGQKDFVNVELEDGKHMRSAVNGDIDVSNVTLLLYVDGLHAGEIREDGSEHLNEYTVSFVDWDGSVIDEQIVEHFSFPVYPPNPARAGWHYIGWDIEMNDIVPYVYSDMTITAEYKTAAVTNVNKNLQGGSNNNLSFTVTVTYTNGTAYTINHAERVNGGQKGNKTFDYGDYTIYVAWNDNNTVTTCEVRTVGGTNILISAANNQNSSNKSGNGNNNQQ
jgi:hypothetical protein